jgi:hypothetical protein
MTEQRAEAVLVAAGSATLTAAGASAAAAATHPSAHAANACAAKVHGRTRIGHFGGIVRAVPVRAGCQVHNTSDAANGTPPLIFHGGAVMGTHSTGPVVVTPIFWNPAGHPMDSAYKKIITIYLACVAGSQANPTCTRR